MMLAVMNHLHSLDVAGTVVTFAVHSRMGKNLHIALHHKRGVLSHRVLHALQEIRRVWVGYMTQADAELGRKLAAKLKSMSAL